MRYALAGRRPHIQILLKGTTLHAKVADMESSYLGCQSSVPQMVHRNARLLTVADVMLINPIREQRRSLDSAGRRNLLSHHLDRFSPARATRNIIGSQHAVLPAAPSFIQPHG